MLRSQISKATGMDIETIRYYEKSKLITPPTRLDNGYRVYSNIQLDELMFIQHCRSMGIGIDEIKALKELKDNNSDCSKANQIIDKNLKLIEMKISELVKLQAQLINLSKRCSTQGTTDKCGIVKSLIKESLIKKNSSSLEL